MMSQGTKDRPDLRVCQHASTCRQLLTMHQVVTETLSEVAQRCSRSSRDTASSIITSYNAERYPHAVIGASVYDHAFPRMHLALWRFPSQLHGIHSNDSGSRKGSIHKSGGAEIDTSFVWIYYHPALHNLTTHEADQQCSDHVPPCGVTKLL